MNQEPGSGGATASSSVGKYASSPTISLNPDAPSTSRTSSCIHTVVLDASGFNNVDATGDHMLRTIVERLHERDIRLLLVNVHDDVRDVLDASGFSEIVGDETYFPTDEDAVAHLEGGAGSDGAA